MPDPFSADVDRALIHVDRAAGELRRGRPVVILAEAEAAAVFAAETAAADALSSLAELAPPHLALTLHRASVLHVRTAGTEPALLPAGGMDIDLVRHLADPTTDLARPLAGPFAAARLPASAVAAAAVVLCKRARLLPSALLALADPAAASHWASARDALAVQAADIAAAEDAEPRSLRQVASARLPLADAEDARILAFRPADGALEHLAIVIGDPPRAEPVLTRLHSECFTGDLLGSLRCDCGEQLRASIRLMQAAGAGVLLYLAQEGRGIGLMNKLRAYRLQDQGFDTIDANTRLGFEADERLFQPAAEMLQRLGFGRVRLLTNNPEKVAGLERCGIEVVERVPHAFPANNHNELYLATKKKRSGHYL